MYKIKNINIIKWEIIFTFEKNNGKDGKRNNKIN